MSNDLFILNVDDTVTDKIRQRYPFSRVLSRRQFDDECIQEVLSKVFTKNFFVMRADCTVGDFDLDMTLEGTEEYVQIWENSDSLRLFHTNAVREDPSAFTDEAMASGQTLLKMSDEKIYIDPPNKIKTNCDVFVLCVNKLVGKKFTDSLALKDVQYKYIESTRGLDAKVMTSILEQCESFYFYVVKPNIRFKDAFDFKFVPDYWDREYVHVWGVDDSLRLFSRKLVEKNIDDYTDAGWESGVTPLKVLNNDLYTRLDRTEQQNRYVEKLSDIFVIGHQPFNVGNKVHHTSLDTLEKDIITKCNTPYFYVVKEGTVVKNFNFDYLPAEEWMEESVHIWDGRDNIKFGNLTSLKQNVLLLDNVEAFVNIDEDIFERYGDDWNVYSSVDESGDDEYFFVVDNDVAVVDGFRYDFVPQVWNKQDVHLWQRINPHTKTVYDYSGITLHSAEERGTVSYVRKPGCISKSFDVVMLSYHEPFADEAFDALCQRVPSAKRVKDVDGIFQAHKRAAEISESPMFFVVDADAVLEDDFDFSYMPRKAEYHKVYVWRSRNPINDLVYGYGGVKLFPRDIILNAEEANIDFTTSISKHFVPISQISNTTLIDTDPFTAWKSAFRECVKLSSKIIHGQLDEETEGWLNVWCSQGSDRKNGEYAIMGANEGKRYGAKNARKKEELMKINDYEWLREQWKSKNISE